MTDAMSGSCAAPRAAATSDTPFGQVADMQRQDIERTVGLELMGCNVCTIVTALDEFDLGRIGKMGHRMETWPEAVRAIMEKELAAFAARNGGARIEAITTAIGGAPKCFVLCVHWRAKP